MDLIVFFPFVALMLILLWRSGRWELGVIRDELADESIDTVTPEEFESIRREGLFQTRRIDSMERKRSSTLVNEQHELAFRKRRVRNDNGDRRIRSFWGGERIYVGCGSNGPEENLPFVFPTRTEFIC
jgi:hypothetical protein